LLNSGLNLVSHAFQTLGKSKCEQVFPLASENPPQESIEFFVTRAPSDAQFADRQHLQVGI
jgi:hypothetical protein